MMFPCKKHTEHARGTTKESYDCSTPPNKARPTPLQGQQKLDRSWSKDGESDDIQFVQCFHECRFSVTLNDTVRDSNEHQKDRKSATNRKVDVEALEKLKIGHQSKPDECQKLTPAPRRILR